MVSLQRRQSLRRKSGLTATVSQYLGVSLLLTSSSAVNSKVPTITSPSVNPLATLQHGQCKVVFNQLPTTPLSVPMVQSQLLLTPTSRSHQRPRLRLLSSLTEVKLWRTPKPQAPGRSPSRSSQPVARRTTLLSLRSPASELVMSTSNTSKNIILACFQLFLVRISFLARWYCPILISFVHPCVMHAQPSTGVCILSTLLIDHMDIQNSDYSCMT